jgi:hypothetical protein
MKILKKLPVLSLGYIRMQKAILNFGVIILGGAVVVLVMLPYFTKFRTPTGVLDGAIILVTLCAFRLISLEEHETIYRAITKNIEFREKAGFTRGTKEESTLEFGPSVGFHMDLKSKPGRVDPGDAQ